MICLSGGACRGKKSKEADIIDQVMSPTWDRKYRAVLSFQLGFPISYGLGIGGNTAIASDNKVLLTFMT